MRSTSMSAEPNTDLTPTAQRAAAPEGDSVEQAYRDGLELQAAGRSSDAAVRFRAAAGLAPDDERIQFSLGKTLHDLGCPDEALEAYRRTIDLCPDCAEAYFNIGLLFWESRRPEEAAAALGQAVILAPGLAAAHNNLGIVLRALGRDEAALASFECAVRAQPFYADAWCNAGRLLFDRERWDEAARCFEQALAHNAAGSTVLHGLGLCHHKKGLLERAEACYRHVLTLHPGHYRAHIDMGNVCLDRGDFDGMADWYRRALAFTPEDRAGFANVARMFRDLGRWDESLTLYDAALRLDPDNAEMHFSRSLIHLTLGRFAEGWPGYEWRCRRVEWSKAYPHALPSPRWCGEPLEGRTLLVHHEQGFGDTLQFVRYLPLAKARGGRVLFEAPAALSRLLRGIDGENDVVELSADGPTRAQHDLHVPLLSLPGLFGTTLESVPDRVPYLFADPDRAAAWAERLDPHALNIGVVWSGSRWTPRLAEKSCPLELLLTLAPISGTHWVALQKDSPPAELTAAHAAGLAIWGTELGDFSDTAAAVAGLDLVIAVDTAVAHLAGAMGKPVWVLLTRQADWRWLLDRTDSPWYPTMRLYRQEHGSSWEGVVARVGRDLEALVRKGPKAP
jgi:tetratricopeptide (TPR) repeat protein